MNDEQKLRAAEELLLRFGWNAEQAKDAAKEALDDGEPLVESLCFQTLAEHLLANIHESAWLENRAKSTHEHEGYDVIKRLLDSGASADDLARFARLMQREYLANLGCILDGSGIFGTPDLPCEDFRVFSINDSGEPEAEIPDLHESLGFDDWEREMKLSREAAESSERKAGGGKTRKKKKP